MPVAQGILTINVGNNPITYPTKVAFAVPMDKLAFFEIQTFKVHIIIWSWTHNLRPATLEDNASGVASRTSEAYLGLQSKCCIKRLNTSELMATKAAINVVWFIMSMVFMTGLEVWF